MKFSAGILVLTLTAASAFNPSSSITNAVRSKASFAPTRESGALVKPINLDGRVNADSFVSSLFHLWRTDAIRPD